MAWVLGSGEKVQDRADGTHLHAGVDPYLDEVFGSISSQDRERTGETVNLGRSVGDSALVETTDEDVIAWSQRPNRAGLTRFVMGRSKRQCESIMVFLRREDYKTYTLLSAFIGDVSENEPWHPDAGENERKFWKNHALVFDGNIIAGTETRRDPGY